MRGWPERVSQRNRPLRLHLLSRNERHRELDLFFFFNSLKSGHMVKPRFLLARASELGCLVQFCLCVTAERSSRNMQTTVMGRTNPPLLMCGVEEFHSSCLCAVRYEHIFVVLWCNFHQFTTEPVLGFVVRIVKLWMMEVPPNRHLLDVHPQRVDM